MVFVVACFCFPAKGYSEDKRAGFYAGPLSAVAESVAEKAALPPDNEPAQEDTAIYEEQVPQEAIEVTKDNGDKNPLHELS